MKQIKKHLFIFMLLSICCTTTIVAQIVQAEYYIDTDPGAGNATAMSATDGSFNDVLESAVKTSINMVSSGLHSINVRVKDNNNNWGPVFTKIISVETLLSTRTTNITQGELYWDADPGQGNGTAMIAFDGNFNDAVESVIKSGLNVPALGTHTLCIRVKDVSGNWGPVFTNVVSVENLLATRSIMISQAELYWDTDPGQGSGTPMLAFDGNFNDAIESVINSGLTVPAVGTHKLCARVKDVAGNWGAVFTTVVSVENLLATRSIKIIQAELYWDTDPGQGSGTTMLAFDGNFNDAIESVINNGLTIPAVGTHKLCVRVKDIAGNWGSVFTNVVSVENLLATRSIKITQGELFFDTDPGQGSGTAMLAFDGNFDNALETLINSGLTIPSLGTHKLTVRVKDVAGNWGPNFTSILSVESIFVPRDIKIVQAELYWDTDPGQGNGTAMLAFDGNFNDAIESVLNSGLTTPAVGTHKLCVRVKDVTGNWGPVFTNIVSIETPLATRNIKITQGELFFDVDPGLGNATSIVALDGNFDNALETATHNVNTTFIAPGIHSLNVRVKDVTGNWGPLYTVAMYIDSCTTKPNPIITVNGSTTICQGDSVQLTTASVFNSYTWVTGLTPLGNGNSIFIKNPGVYKVTVTDGGGCPGTSEPVTISVFGATVSSNSSATYCHGDSVLISGIPATSYAWNTGANTQSIYVHAVGSYTVTETNSNGCTFTSVFNVTENPVPGTPSVTQNGPDLVSSAPSYNQWYLNGALINGATSTIYSPTITGNYTVSVTNNLGCSSTSAPLYFSSVGVPIMSQTESVLVFPNPFSSITTLTYQLQTQSIVDVELFNVLGMRVLKIVDNQKQDFGSYTVPIEQNDLPSGMYMLKVSVNGSIKIIRLVKQD